MSARLSPQGKMGHGVPRRRSVSLNYSIGDVAVDPYAAALAVQHRIADRGACMVLVAPAGSVYSMAASEIRAEMLADEYPAWVAGVFNFAASAKDIQTDMVETWEGIRK